MNGITYLSTKAILGGTVELLEDGVLRTVSGTPEETLGAPLRRILAENRVAHITISEGDEEPTSWRLYPVKCEFSADQLTIKGRGTRQGGGQPDEPVADREIVISLQGNLQAAILAGVAPAVSLRTPGEQWLLIFDRGTIRW
jgi:hypothetical protein